MRRDTNGDPIQVGAHYRTGRRGHRARALVLIEESMETDLICVAEDGSRMRLDDMAEDAVFEAIESDQADALGNATLREKLCHIGVLAGRARDRIESIEAEACRVVGVGLGDGSDLSDWIMRFVRDGFGDVDQCMALIHRSERHAIAQ